jgi:hypothetical protein
MIGSTLMPGVFMSMRRKEIPSCGLPSLEVRTRQKIQSAHCATEVQIFEPLTRKWSPMSSAFVFSEARSDPAPGSE